MALFQSDGKKLLDVEYDTLVEVGDVVDGMRVLSIQSRGDEYCAFLLDPLSRQVTCYVFDEIYIIGRSPMFETLNEAVEAWLNDEI